MVSLNPGALCPREKPYAGDNKQDEIHKNMDLIHITKMGDSEYWFALRDVSDQEITQKAFMSAASMMAVKTLSDEEALTVAAVFPEWSADSVNYKKDDRVRYGDTLYKCLQDHISQSAWAPEDAVSLWVRTDDPAIEWPEWVQPTGAHDSYSKGAKVKNEEISYENVENMFRGWMGGFYKLLSREQRKNLIGLYEDLFEKSITIVNKKIVVTDKIK